MVRRTVAYLYGQFDERVAFLGKLLKMSDFRISNELE